MRSNEISIGQVAVEKFLEIRKKIKAEQKKLVWTNGCFDLLHNGHIVYLRNAKKMGDYLIVGLNSDVSFRKWKNRPGPIHSAKHRASVLIALRSVDYVIIFDEPSPLLLLKKIGPDVYVKGDDYNLARINQKEREVIESCGGEIKFCSGISGMSTSNTIKRILQLYRDGR